MPLKNRRANPPVVTAFSRFKPCLREDFDYECAYCGLHENDLGGPRFFGVEHFRPKKKFRSLELDYSNTLYACCVCNSYKGEDWPSDNPLVDGKGYIDPCCVDYSAHFTIDSDYVISGTTPVGQYMAKRLRLHRMQVSKKLRSRATARDTHLKVLARLDQLIQLLDARATLLPSGRAEREVLENEMKEIRRERMEAEARWNERWKPQVDLEDYE